MANGPHEHRSWKLGAADHVRIGPFDAFHGRCVYGVVQHQAHEYFSMKPLGFIMSKRIAFALIEHGRATEWLTSLALLGFAVTLALPGETLARSGFGTFRSLGLDDAMLAVPLSLIASARMVALYINGAWKRSPILRLAGAITGAVIFAMIGMGLGWPYAESLMNMDAISIAASTGASTYTVLALFDVLAAYRSSADLNLARCTAAQ